MLVYGIVFLMLYFRMINYAAWFEYGELVIGSMWQNSSVIAQTFSASIDGRNSLAQSL